MKLCGQNLAHQTEPEKENKEGKETKRKREKRGGVPYHGSVNILVFEMLVQRRQPLREHPIDDVVALIQSRESVHE